MTHASQTKAKASAGDPIPPKCSVIEVHVGELRQLFNAIDRRVRCLRRRIPHHPTELPFSVGFARLRTRSAFAWNVLGCPFSDSL
jgi:hypothetical protein